MEFTVIRERFFSTLQKAGYFISSKINNNGALRGVYIEAHKEGIVIKTSSISEFFVGEVGGKVSREGAVLVDFKTLFEVIKTVQDTKIDVENSNNVFVIKSAQGVVKIPTLDFSNFPQPPALDKADELEPSLFDSKTVGQLLFSAATDETRPILTGVCFDFLEGRANIVSTDGFRMSLVTLQNKKTNKPPLNRKLVISARSLVSLHKVLQDQVKKVLYGFGAGYIQFFGEGCSIFVRLLDGEYPPYERVIPQDKETTVLVKKDELFSLIKTASLFAREGSNMVSFVVGGEDLLLNSSSASLGEASLRVPLIEKDGSDNKITFNYRYVLDFLQAVTDNEISLQITNPFSPGVFRTTKDNNTLLHIIMPIRTES